MLLSEQTGDEPLRYYYDAAGKVVSLTYKKDSNAEVSYFYARNLQRDIIAVYRSRILQLNARYYEPEIERLISANSLDVLMIAIASINCNNLFSYGENKPANNNRKPS